MYMNILYLVILDYIHVGVSPFTSYYFDCCCVWPNVFNTIPERISQRYLFIPVGLHIKSNLDAKFIHPVFTIIGHVNVLIIF